MAEVASCLAVAGVAGAFFRSLVWPEPKWYRRVIQGLAGAVSAIFLGGLLGHIINSVTSAGFYGFAAAGFLMGSGGEAAVKALQDRFVGRS